MIIKIGCCGWCESQERYLRDFGVIEIQEAFYQIPRVERVRRWREKAPEGFEFTLKASQLITHHPSSPTYRRLKEELKDRRYGSFQPSKGVFEAWERTREIAKILNVNVILFQSPPSFRPTQENKENMMEFFDKIKRREFICAWEPRGDWERKEIKDICDSLDLVHCTDPFKETPVSGGINYFRLHGKPGYNLRYDYTEKDLRELKKFCDKEENYVFFNNLSMLKDAKDFQEMMK